ncbi:hypothetical protein WA026_016141 [Henosepilachna vigintioctopunctata]|uniref:Uncharacterized protein n=1 Tax=Henosepilachna vigintioctopunctata TaxID=420089 RepID=A0AAW1TL70_9CUCU
MKDMKFIVSTFFLLTFLKASVAVQDDTNHNQVHNVGPTVKIQSQEYYQQRPIEPQYVTQPYVPVPIHLIQRSVFSQQPQAALIVIKAYPIQLTPAQSANLHQGNIQSIIQNMLPYNSAPRIPIYATAQPTQARSVLLPVQQKTNSVNYATTPSPPSSNIYYAPSATNKQGDNYLNQLAQMVALQYSKTPSYKAPAIITGLENFSTDQQDQIKNYLKNYISSRSQDSGEQKNVPEHREGVNAGVAADGKYSSKIPADSYTQQTEWVPTIQKVLQNEKTTSDKSR